MKYIPQIIIVLIWVCSILVALKKHGTRRRSGKHNMRDVLLRVLLYFTLLLFGGFFNSIIDPIIKILCQKQ